MLVVGIGGTSRQGSSSECALRTALRAVDECGIETRCFAGTDLLLPLYDPRDSHRSGAAALLVDALRLADGVIISSPAYHGSVSGLVKNALDYTEDLARDRRVYLDGLPVGCIGVAMGMPGAVSTTETLRSIVHALRGWPTPYAATIRVREGLFAAPDRCEDATVERQLLTVGRQVAEFALRAGPSVPAAA